MENTVKVRFQHPIGHTATGGAVLFVGSVSGQSPNDCGGMDHETHFQCGDESATRGQSIVGLPVGRVSGIPHDARLDSQYTSKTVFVCVLYCVLVLLCCQISSTLIFFARVAIHTPKRNQWKGHGKTGDRHGRKGCVRLL